MIYRIIGTPGNGETREDGHELVDAVRPHLVRVLTPRGRGTGFQFHRPGENLVVIATAAHVINHAHAWEEPIRITHSESTESILLKSTDRAVFLDEDRDTAAILFASDKLPSLPKETFTLAPAKRYYKVGNQIGWLGFPSVASSQSVFLRRPHQRMGRQ